MIKGFFLCLAVLLVGSGLMVTGSAQGRRHEGFSISTGPGRTITDCSQIRVSVRYGQVFSNEQTQTLPGSTSPLQIQAPKNGGIHVQGYRGGDYVIKTCMYATGDSVEEARSILAQLSLSTNNGQLTVNGPSGNDWIAYLIVQAPNGSVIEMDSTNGPIGVSDFSGTVTARTQNGPISFEDVTGQARAEASRRHRP